MVSTFGRAHSIIGPIPGFWASSIKSFRTYRGDSWLGDGARGEYAKLSRGPAGQTVGRTPSIPVKRFQRVGPPGWVEAQAGVIPRDQRSLLSVNRETHRSATLRGRPCLRASLSAFPTAPPQRLSGYWTGWDLRRRKAGLGDARRVKGCA